MNRLLALSAMVTVVASACLGGGAADTAKPKLVLHPQALSEQAWIAAFAAREAVALGDPSVKTALVAPITAAQARLVFQHRRRAYPGHTYLVVLHGSFVSPPIVCPAGVGCPGYVPRLFGWEVMLAGPTLGRLWRGFGIETNRPLLRSMPVGLRTVALVTHPTAPPRGPLLRFAVTQAMRMAGTQMRDFGFARISAAQASHLFGGTRSSGYLVMEHGLFRHSPGASADRDPWFAWAALEYRPSLRKRPAAFRAITHPRKFVRSVQGVRINWTGLPLLAGPGRNFYWGGG